MFNGITQGLCSVAEAKKKNYSIQYTVAFSSDLLLNLRVGSSVAIDGVCQTVEAISGDRVTFTAIPETLTKTTLSDLYPGQEVSIEKSLRLGDELGGHEIAGHVFEKALIIAKKSENGYINLLIQASLSCLRFIYEKGFVALDGSSLTVGAVDRKQGQFRVHLIPETIRTTNLGKKPIGAYVNLEIDPLSLKLQNLLESYFLDFNQRLLVLEKNKNL